MRNKVVVGNWKMNNTKQDVDKFFEDVNNALVNENTNEFGVCLPSVYLSFAKSGKLNFGAQNMYFEDKGAYTGEVSPLMLKDLNAKYVILGHSERREYFNETDEIVNLKVKKALEHNLVPIFCCGETLEQYNNKVTKEVVEKQIVNGLKGIQDVSKVIIAYEPIWAIGTGLSATSTEANEVCKFIREVLSNNFTNAQNTIIQYGGSVNPNNIKEYLSTSDIDGALVGGASLTSNGFIDLINALK